MDVGLAGPLAILPILLASAINDLRHLRIPNTHVVCVLCVFAVSLPFLPSWSELGYRLFAAGLAFGVGFTLFALRMFGGGDVKMLAAVVLVVSSTDQLLFLQLFSTMLLATSLGIVIVQRLPAGLQPAWQSVQQRGHVPVAVAFAASLGALVMPRLLGG
jgi:prepilin peptidase CpaA